MMPFDSLDDAVRHRLHHDPVDVRDFVVAGVDRIQRSHADGNVPVHVQTLLARFRRRGRQPVLVQRAVELHADEAIGLRLGDERDRLGLAGRHVRDLRRVRAFAIDER